ncbi:MAG: hypothetical protein HC816_20985 [Leptolyngbyaceae cyanobacterium RM1_1_2]|nr:hypothetical protein [Leptolyngbyaceae cyanobacterium RM1_1_2]
MSRWFRKRLRPRLVWITLLLLVWLLCSAEAVAGTLSDRLRQFPDWTTKPPVQTAVGDLAYPDWIAGTWQMTTTLIDLVAPLAPEIITPGFESNRQFLERPVVCQVRFVPERLRPSGFVSSLRASIRSSIGRKSSIVSDRAFNGLSLAKAYLGNVVKSVKVDPDNPNRQVTILSGDRQLESTVTQRAIEMPQPDRFVTSEIFQQVFRGSPRPYLNEVETTTAYTRLAGQKTAIAADQVTAIYLSPQDPDYFKASNQPVALYRYRLEFQPVFEP